MIEKEYEERRECDNGYEKIVTKLLEKYIYCKFPDYKHNNEKESQKAGIDCKFTGKDGLVYSCDEKAATRICYINAGRDYNDGNGLRRRLGTFCIEQSCRVFLYDKNHWVRLDGWWLNENEKNNLFCFVWIDETESGYLENCDDVLDFEAIFVKREEIDNWFLEKGWTKERLKITVKDISNNIYDWFKKENKWQNGNAYDTKTIDGIKFNVPRWLLKEEAPINVLIGRNEYRKMIPENERPLRIFQYKNRERVNFDEIKKKIDNNIN